jgi:hypothetical protein
VRGLQWAAAAESNGESALLLRLLFARLSDARLPRRSAAEGADVNAVVLADLAPRISDLAECCLVCDLPTSPEEAAEVST